MHRIHVAGIALVALAACRAAEPLREFSARDDRLRALDSLARVRPCTMVQPTVLFDSTAWTRRHACAVAARALQLLGTARTKEPYIAPADTARVRVMRVTRQRWCQIAGTPNADPPGRMDSLQYVVEIEVPERPNYLAVVMNAQTFVGGATFDAHPRGVWGGSPHLARPIERPDTLEAGAPCGQ